MTLFDIIALSLLAVSGIAGFVRGAAREMAAVLARFRTYGRQPNELGPGERPPVEAAVRRDPPPGGARTTRTRLKVVTP